MKIQKQYKTELKRNQMVILLTGPNNDTFRNDWDWFKLLSV